MNPGGGPRGGGVRQRRDLRVVRGAERYPFSAGEIVEALQGAGVLTDVALGIARDVERRFRAGPVSDVALDDLLDEVERLVRERVTPEAGARFRAQTPPFVPLMVRKGSERETFSRRTLSQSLEKFELNFKEAHAIATQVEQTLRTEGYEEIDEAELSHVITLALEARFGREARLRYESTLSHPTDLYVIEPDGSRLPYSRGILSRSLMSVGLGPDLSYQVAKLAEAHLWRAGDLVVSRGEVRRLVTRLLNEQAGEEFARRYELLHSLRHSEHPAVVLVGGAPGVGKSTIASELSYRLGIPRLVSTDSIRQALRSLISAELSPILHSSTYAAWRAELLPEEQQKARPKRKRVVRGFMGQVRQLGTALNAIIDRSLDEAVSLVVEGVHLVAGVSPRGPFDGAIVVPLVLVVEDEESHRNHFSVRERRTHARRAQDTYLEHFTEVRIIQDYLVERAREEGVPVIDATDLDQAVDKAMDHVLNSLLVSRLPREPERAPSETS